MKILCILCQKELFKNVSFLFMVFTNKISMQILLRMFFILDGVWALHVIFYFLFFIGSKLLYDIDLGIMLKLYEDCVNCNSFSASPLFTDVNMYFKIKISFMHLTTMQLINGYCCVGHTTISGNLSYMPSCTVWGISQFLTWICLHNFFFFNGAHNVHLFSTMYNFK